MTIEDKLIEDVTNKIVKQFKPQKVILFGSLAWGLPTPESDLDLFIVMPSNLRRDDRSQRISQEFPDRIFSLDTLVYTPQEVEQSVKRNNLFIKEILEKGKVLYAQ